MQRGVKEILLTSSVLILALLLLRRIFRRRISRRMQYALWALVLVRLLLPASLPAVDFSVLSLSQPVQNRMEEHWGAEEIYVLPVSTQEITLSSAAPPEEPDILLPVEGRYTAVSHERGQPAVLTAYLLTLEEAIGLVWGIGVGSMVLWLAGTNLSFWTTLRRRRIPLEFPECKYPVYLVEEGLVSPCLFGLFRPAVYLTTASMASEEDLRHVLAHEEAHARQGDPLWSLLRGICLAVYWFDPLVWWAARASREDCELACDELALRKLGEGHRIPYGQTLLRLIPVKKLSGGVLLTATTMASDKRRLTERIARIAENRRMRRTALCAALAATAAVCVMTFTGCSASGTEPDAPGVQRLAISLAALDSYEPAEVETIPADSLFSGHHLDGHHGKAQNRHHADGGCRATEHHNTFVWSYDGATYVSCANRLLSAYPDDYFLGFPDQTYEEEAFTDLFGYDGVRITYRRQPGAPGDEPVNDYYVFEENRDGGVDVRLLARVYGQPQLIDLDGDGIMELVSTDGHLTCQIVYQRGDRLYEASVNRLIHEFWTDPEDAPTFYRCSPEDRCLYLQSGSGSTMHKLCFDGENLLLYAQDEENLPAGR